MSRDTAPSGFTTRRVAEQAGTSVPAVYELFQDKSGLLRAVFFEGFRMLSRELLTVPETDDAVTDVQRLIPVFRRFCLDYPALARVMFSRPFQDFDPGPEELASPSVREIFVGKSRVHRCGAAHRRPGRHRARIARSSTGLAVQEGARWLGKSKASVNRRWEVGVTGILRGFAR